MVHKEQICAVENLQHIIQPIFLGVGKTPDSSRPLFHEFRLTITVECQKRQQALNAFFNE
jgi:hypothetical protein